MSKMSDLALSIEELACAGYCSSEIAEVLNYPVELVESFLEEFELQAMVEVFADWKINYETSEIPKAIC